MTPRRDFRVLAANLLLAGIYVAAGKLGLQFAFLNRSATAVWPPTGIALIGLLVFGWRVSPAVFLGAFLVNITTQGNHWTALGIAAGNTAEGLVAAWLVNRFAAGLRAFHTAKHTLVFAFLAGLMSTAISAVAGPVILALGRYAEWKTLGSVSVTWWLGDAAGALVFAPAVVLWLVGERPRWNLGQAVERAAYAALLVASCWLAFDQGAFGSRRNLPLAFLCFPVLLWPALRFGQRATATGIVVLSSISLVATLNGRGPFAVAGPHVSLLILQGFVCVISVVSLTLSAAAFESRSAAEAARLRENELHLVTDSMPVLIADVDNRERFRFTNSLHAAFFGKDARTLRGRTLRDLLGDAVHLQIRDQIAAALTGRRVQFEWSIPAKSGGERHVESVFLPYRRDSGAVAGFYALTSDITDRMKAVRERDELLASERAARRESERLGRIKDEFLATLSHELRTPLNAILGWAQLLRASPDARGGAEGLAVIERNARAQARIIDDLLDMSGIISGKARLVVQPLDPADVIRAALDTVRPAAAAKRIAVVENLDPGSGAVLGDPSRLQQVVWNLLSNAIKFTPEGGTVRVRSGRVDSTVEIVVSDTGSGIPADFLPHVFERFRQAEPSLTRRHRGLGLGLAIVKQLVELHGGTVRAESEGPGRGSTFVVRLPLCGAPAGTDGSSEPARPERAGILVPGDPERLKSRKVLVVDDEQDALEFVERLLGDLGAEVRTAESASRALAILDGWNPDVIVCDIGMPDEDGYGLLRKIRRREEPLGRSTPAVALTAFARPEDVRRALEAGFQAHVAKPLETAELLTALSGLLATPKGAAGAETDTCRP